MLFTTYSLLVCVNRLEVVLYNRRTWVIINKTIVLNSGAGCES